MGNEKNSALPVSAEEGAQTVTRKGGEGRGVMRESHKQCQGPSGEMIHGNTVHLLKECDIFLGAWQGIYFKVCLTVALIFQEVRGKINTYLLNISYRIKFSIVFFILLQSA